MNITRLFYFIFVILCASPFNSSFATPKIDKLVAECIDSDLNLGYRVFQTDDSGLLFRAEEINSKVKIKKVDLLIFDHSKILWAADVSSKYTFQLLVNRNNVNDEGTDALLTTHNFQGHIRCQKLFPTN